MSTEGGAWSPYLVEALIGVLSMFTFYFSDKPLGVSTAYGRLAGMVSRLISQPHTDSLKFYQDKKPKVEWEVMLTFGVVLGAFLAAATGGELTGSWWEACCSASGSRFWGIAQGPARRRWGREISTRLRGCSACSPAVIFMQCCPIPWTRPFSVGAPAAA